jgi:dolichyl-phosphate beta-glucosyltransferase
MKLTIILPVRNQTAKLIKNLIGKIIPYFDASGVTYDIIIESDSSDEPNQKTLEEAMKKLPAQVRLLPYESTRGKGYAVKRAILASEGDYVLFMDADLSTDLSAFDAIKPLLGQYDAFIGTRHSKQSRITEKQTTVRRLTSWGSRFIIRHKFHLRGITDTQCGYKLFRTDLAKAMVKKQIIPGFAFDVEYVYFIFLNGFRIKEIPVTWANDADSSVSPLKASIDFYKSLKLIKKNTKNYLLSKEEREALSHAD